MDANDCGTEEPNFSMEEAEVPRETVKFQAISEHPQHLPRYASLPEYSLRTPRTLHPDSSLQLRERPDQDESTRTRSAPPQPISHLAPIDADKSHYIPSPSSSPLSSSSWAGSQVGSGPYISRISPPPVTNLPTVKSCQSTVSRESQSSRQHSPRSHEIQSPSGRLSAHQMLLLTPFGGQLPATALSTPGGSLGMSRVSSNANIPEAVAISADSHERSSAGSSVSMKCGRSDCGSLMEVSSSSIGLGIGTGAEALDMSKDMSLSPMSRLPTRPCQPLNVGSDTIQPSSPVSGPASFQVLLSRPDNEQDLKQERSQSPVSGTGLRHGPRVANKSANNNDADDGRLQLMPPTVAMTRCNSQPVLTLRELQAIREKDGDLGIQRGGHWAWVSREVMVDEDGNEVDEDGNQVIESIPQDTIFTGSATVLAHRRPSFTTFQDPFAGGPLYSSAQPYIPIATPSNDPPAYLSRRMSEMPSVVSDASPVVLDRDTRRPSMPVVLEVGRGSKGSPHPLPLRSHLSYTSTPSFTLAHYQGTRRLKTEIRLRFVGPESD
ncbi:hypothetical protein C343_06621 [Cryptococcus neoformans C23]|uniref:Uncharacterized protein n=1 Tax=Cryptococcus neoformans (strain H99 / ATCC 208821 / CBS 10515 / FGSC 9487) TaxID=235443 RepID=J9VWL2_CRYN9|nr:hypothetical protein CNAG_06405 [Cryptococcus neoformans var. grubii H99]AUB28818.1 hypothetical protein CKF44_06405 [Cryptococcus neoformans var. grubii]OWZ26969.1 hypothetical protein C347_06619 [Cryptococcus neoformans var. grubii AD2-60a]OWZ27800.1 hypothetical protein C353_06651 [Cryptococcus neoformans var. grubii AD1-83a]OWZ38830.1 hypothetical protein C343_06621 [Cryptococcus neoformans var. grubii C23]OXC81227.1 hypothetical protein C344_06527 [Cryptococcus neoformans var. grubii A|eukprot:XP_012053473.1 hypothetical protein CNAG_06405 [Cryptococcus neoformans var. grubii H99]